MSEDKKVFILNKPFEGSYADEEGNVAHEIIDYFKADNGKIYIYNNPWGHCPSNIDVDGKAEYKLEYMFLAKKAKIKGDGSEFELTHLIKIKRVLHHQSRHDDDEKRETAQGVVREIIHNENDKITYGGEYIDEIYGPEDESLFVTFEAEKVYKAKSIIKAETTGYKFQRNKGYVKSDENDSKDYNELAKYTANISNYWIDITDDLPKIKKDNYKPNKSKTFLDLIMKVDSEECYTNMLYWILGWKDTLNLFAKKFSKGKQVDANKFEVKRELKIDRCGEIKGGRTDVCAFNDSQRIVIENKVFSGLNGVDKDNDITQLTIYHNWANSVKTLESLCFITCPDFRVKEIEAEIEDGMKSVYTFVKYSEISEFIKSLDDKGHFKGFIFENYIKDIVNAFKKYNYQNKSELFEQYFLEAIENIN